jgi:hypothetical protein
VYIHANIYVYICVYMCMCMSIYIYIYIYIYIRINKYVTENSFVVCKETYHYKVRYERLVVVCVKYNDIIKVRVLKRAAEFEENWRSIRYCMQYTRVYVCCIEILIGAIGCLK